MDSDIGHHWCLLDSNLCNQRDYLPILCPLCQSYFCRDHIHEHSCATDVPSPPSTTDFQLCHFCEKIQIAVCTTCRQAFCVQHRVHPCTREEEKVKPRTKAAPRPVPALPTNPKNKPIGDKLQRMLVRKRATGDESIPEESRVALHFECSEGSFPVDVFVAGYQAMGVALDLAARKGRVDARRLKARKKDGTELDANVQVGSQLQTGDIVTLEPR